MRAFDLSHIKAEVARMDEGNKWNKWRDDHPDHEGSKFSFLVPRLVKVAHSAEHLVHIKDPAKKMPLHMRFASTGKTLGLCQTSQWDGAGDIYIHPDLSPDERCRVLTHEITHALGANRGSLGTNEITAECVSHLVCREFGLDTWDFAYPYMAYNWWCEGGNFIQRDIDLYASEILNNL